MRSSGNPSGPACPPAVVEFTFQKSLENRGAANRFSRLVRSPRRFRTIGFPVRLPVGDGRADYSAKHRRHGVNVQVVTDAVGRLLWLSPALPGRAHDLTAARTHRIIRICERQGVPVLADLAFKVQDRR